ncbi:MAG: hypothetical protein AABW88_00735 [Nanoarchaeota archaeon]
MNKKKVLFLPILFLVFIKQSFAHCPLCVMGAATLAMGASYMGVNKAIIGLFIGAFAVAIGWWVARLIKKQFIPHQKLVIILFSFLTTVIPMMSYISGAYPLYVPFLGQYGTTFAIDLFLTGSVLGGFVVLISPWLSEKVTEFRKGKQLPFQGLSLMFVVLLLLGTIIQLVA